MNPPNEKPKKTECFVVEYGQVLVSVLTESEGEGLQDMVDGLMHRYSTAGVDSPLALHVDIRRSRLCLLTPVSGSMNANPAMNC